MSRSLLIIIADFLLLSLLALARFEIEPPPPTPDDQEAVPDYSEGETDLVEVLTFAMEEERRAREHLTTELNKAQDALREREQLLSAREERIAEVQQALSQKEQEAQRLARERLALQEQFTVARSQVETLAERLDSTTTEAQSSKERIEELQTELVARREAALRMQKDLEQLEQVHQATEEQKRQLNTQLQVAETEKRLTRQQLDTARGEVATVREEKAQIQQHADKLASGVTNLAAKSEQLTEEIRENRPLAPNTIFNEFIANRVQARFQATRSGFLGRTVDRVNEPKTVLVTDGSRTYTIYHVKDTPFEFGEAGSEWDRLSGYVLRHGVVYSIPQVSFLSADPRLVVVAVGTPQAERLGSKIYSTSATPYRFPEAVVVGANEGFYGEATFHVDPGTPGYIKMGDPRLSRRLTGKFSPSSGDFVFTKSGELLGLMVNDEYCAVLEKILPARSIRLGSELSREQTRQTVSQMRDWKDRLPFRLQ